MVIILTQLLKTSQISCFLNILLFNHLKYLVEYWATSCFLLTVFQGIHQWVFHMCRSVFITPVLTFTNTKLLLVVYNSQQKICTNTKTSFHCQFKISVDLLACTASKNQQLRWWLYLHSQIRSNFVPYF